MSQLAARIYLASRSPRRRELLNQIRVGFDVLAFRSGAREDAEVSEAVLHGEVADDYVLRVARAKAEFGARVIGMRRLVPRAVLAADTTVEVEGRILGKPADGEDAARMLRLLAGREHRVLTAIAMSDGYRLELALSVSRVAFGELDEEAIRRYVGSGEPLDKAGAYGIQGRAAVFVRELQGSYSGIMGLPLYETGQLLGAFGYTV